MPNFSSSIEEYDEYTKNLQMEYPQQDNEVYKKDRLKMLKTLLLIPFIYSNEQIRKKFEETARKNIKMEIDKLERN